MSESNKNGYILLSSSDEWYKQLSHAELQKVVADNTAWVERLVAQGKVKGGHALGRTSATISGNNQRRVIADGPFAESKEAIGGTLVLDIATMDEAIAIARECPGLRYNMTIEVRPISDECPIDACARAKAKEEQLVAVAV